MVWAILGNFVFKPYFALLEQREQRTTGDQKRASHFREETKKVQEKIDGELQAARLQGIQVRDERVAKARAEAQRIIDDAMGKAADELAKRRDGIAKLKAQARLDLSREVEIIAQELMKKVMSSQTKTMVH